MVYRPIKYKITKNMIEEIGKLSASVSQSAKDLVPSIPATGLTSNHLRLNFARQVATFAMVIFLVMAILVTIKN